MVIPGPPEGGSPEPMHTGLWNMGSGLAAARRPGMTDLGPFRQNGTPRYRAVPDRRRYRRLGAVLTVDPPSPCCTSVMVIPGPPEGWSPEPMHTGLWNMGSGLAAARRPGMTGLGALRQNGTTRYRAVPHRRRYRGLGAVLTVDPPSLCCASAMVIPGPPEEGARNLCTPASGIWVPGSPLHGAPE
jgi:hypothetical protein